MKYYAFEPCGVETTKYCEPELFGEWEDEFLKANRWRNRKLPLPVTMTVNNKYRPGDYPLADSHLVSERLLSLIRHLNRNFETLPTAIYYRKKEPIWGGYHTVLFPEYEAFNFEKSEYTLFRDKIVGLKKLVLSEEKLSRIESANNIFVLKETHLDLICTQTAKNAIEAEDIKDVRFTEIPAE